MIGKEFVHFKGGHYRLVGYAKDSETLEPMCVYEALYGEGGLWVRPAEMFFGTVDRPGYTGPRFRIYSPNKLHRHGHGGNKCIWCGSTSTGAGCIYSPTRRHEK